MVYVALQVLLCRLYGHNVTGCESLIDLVLLTIDKLKKIELVDPTDEQLETIRLGRFRIYNVDIKRLCRVLFGCCELDVCTEL